MIVWILLVVIGLVVVGFVVWWLLRENKDDDLYQQFMDKYRRK